MTAAFRRLVASGVVLALAAGCATPRAPPPLLRSPLSEGRATRSVAVVVRTTSPAPAAGGAAEDALRAGAGSAVGGAVGSAPLALVWGPAVMGGAALAAGGLGLVGAAWLGASRAMAESMAADLDRAVQGAALRRDVPPLLAKALERTLVEIGDARAEVIGPEILAGGDPATSAAARARGHGALIEVNGLDLRFVTLGGPDAEFVLALFALARLVDPIDGATLGIRFLLVESTRYTAAAWTADGGMRVTREAERAVRTLAERIVETFVLEVPVERSQPTFRSSGSCGVEHVEPRGRQTALQQGPEPTPVNSREPRLAWSARPQPSQGYAVPARATDFRYDLRVWQVADGRVGDLVVERFGLEAPSYTVQTPLAPDTTHGWSVRVRYRVDGVPRASRWSAVAVTGYGSGRLPAEYRHAFREDELCSHEYLHACGCMDFLPAAALWKFRTPAQ